MGCSGDADTRDFYPRSPCGERQLTMIFGKKGSDFYPRSPCGERLMGCSGDADTRDFYPRSPCGERPSRYG